MSVEGFVCGRRHFRDHNEFGRWFELRAEGFSEWYVPATPHRSLANSRHVANCKSAVFNEFFHQIRTRDGRAVGYLATVPGYWSGHPEALSTYAYISEALAINRKKMLGLTAWYVFTTEWLRRPGLFEPFARRLRNRRMEGVNTVFLLAMTVDTSYRGQNVPGLLIDAAKASAHRLGCDYVASPFRPNGYGSYKAARKLAHSDELFSEYCRSTNAEGLPIDPWLRAVVRKGARLMIPVPRSLTVSGSLARFERFRGTFRSGDWYSPAEDVWECGETCTWYIDRSRQLALAVEPNMWGAIDLRETAAQN